MNPRVVGALAALGVLVVGGIGFAYSRRMISSPFAPPPLVSGESVLLLGDSLGVGMSQHLANALAPAGVHLDAEAHVGWNAKQVRKAYEADASMVGDAVVISLGSNDAAMMDPSVEAEDVAALVATARARGAKRVVWIVAPNFARSPPPPPATSAKQMAFRALMEAQTVEVMEPSDEVVAMIGGDGIHLPPNGYAAFGQQVAAWLLS